MEFIDRQYFYIPNQYSEAINFINHSIEIQIKYRKFYMHYHIPEHTHLQGNLFKSSLEILNDSQIPKMPTQKQNYLQKTPIKHQNIIETHSSQLITVPIKQYSNKFLRDKKKQEMQNHSKKKQPIINNHLLHNRKLISDFKKIKGRSQKFKKSFNKDNGDFIIHQFLLEKSQSTLLNTSHNKTIFSHFDQNHHAQSIKQAIQESCLFDKGWKTSKNEDFFQTKKEVYDKICQKQKSLIPEYRKKSKTFMDVSQSKQNKQRKIERISTSRALQKYSKIIKINPEHGKIQKMKIKKQLAKSLRFQNPQKVDFQTKQIVLSQKQNPYKIKNVSVLNQSNTNQSFKITNKNEIKNLSSKTTDKQNLLEFKENIFDERKGVLVCQGKMRRMRKFSHQLESYKKCMTEQKVINQSEDHFQEFQINGWDINL